MKAVLYARVSSKEQEREGFSIPAQRKLLQEYASKNGITIAKEFTDVETAKVAGRSQFGKMVEYFQSNPDIKTVLVEKTDRLYRNFRDYVTLEDLELDIHLVKEGEIISKDSRSHMKFIHGIKVLMAKNYIDNLSEEVKKGMREKAEQGEWPCKAPFGYVNNKESHKIEIDPEKGQIVVKLFELYASGDYSISTLHEKVKGIGFTSRKLGMHCSRSNIERILKNPIYAGTFIWNGNSYSAKHVPLISQELFDKVQHQLKRANKPKYTKHRFPFRGLLICGYCGSSITAEIKKGKYIYYRCTNGRGKCVQPYIREERLAHMFAEIVSKIKLDEETVEQIRIALKDSFELEKKFRTEKLTKLRHEHVKAQNIIDQAYIDRVEGRISDDFWRRQHNRWTIEQNRITNDMTRLEKANRDHYQNGIDFLELTEHAAALYLKQNVEEKAKLLKTILSNCVIKDLTLYPTYKKPFDILVDRAASEIKLARL